MATNLKRKIININSYSILLIVFFFAVFNFLVVYVILNDTYKKEVGVIKQQYLASQKIILKNQINNFINFVEHTRKIVKKEKLELIENNVIALSKVLEVSNPKNFSFILTNSKKKNPCIEIGLSDDKANVIFTTGNSEYHKKFRIKAIKKGFGKVIIFHTKKGIKYSYLLEFVNKIDNKKYVIGNAIFQSTIDKIAQELVIDRLRSIRFGVKNNGYISIAKVLDYQGGKKFAQVVALPVKPQWEGKYLDDSKKDAKGKMYRKEYLKIINTTKEGYVSYWFYKKKDDTKHPKISYVKLYKPFDWMIFTSVYLDDIYGVILHKEKLTKDEIRHIFIIYIIFLILFLTIAYVIGKYENRVLQKIIDNYEEQLQDKNQELAKLNQNLQQEVEEKTRQLVESLFIDPLTQLPNREKLIVDFEKKKYVGLLNIDSFKEINDFYGVEIGDIVLKKVGEILNDVRNVYKLAGDEFGIIDNDLENLKQDLLKISDVLNNTKIELEKNIIIELTMSFGIGESLSQADMALKYSKSTKNKMIVFDTNLPIVKEYENNLKWKNIIKQAIKNDNILVFVQPIVSNKTKKIEKYECLIRLKDDEKIYSPYFFLDISKKTGQYQELQKIMIKKSFEKFQYVASKFSVNLSVNDLKNSNFKTYFLDMVREYGLEKKIIVELLEDEGLLYQDVIEFLLTLKNLGIEIAIDDFGSGYSNFSYLITKLPVTILKIDGSLIKNIPTNEKHLRLLKTIVNMAKEFELSIVAEFVENEDIVKLLEELRVDYLQGYYFSEPFDIEKLI